MDKDKILQKIAEPLNKLHEVDYPYLFWKTLLSGYVANCIKNKELFDSSQNHQIDLFDVILTKSNRKVNRFRNLRYHFKSLLNFKTKNKISWILQQHDIIVIDPRESGLVEFTGGVAGNEEYPILLGRADRSKREAIRQIAASAENSFLAKILSHVPKFYVEYFQYLESRITLHNPENKIFHAELISSPFTNMLVQKYRCHGANLNLYQGGWSGVEIEGGNSYKISGNYDKYYTYGWKLTDQTIPFGAVRLENFKRVYNTYPSEKKYDLMLCYSTIKDSNRDQYKHDTDVILSNLDRDKFQKVIARPRPKTNYLNANHVLKYLNLTENNIDLDKNTKRKSVDTVAISSLVVHFRHPTTNFLECVYVDHPVVAVLTNKPSDLSKKYYDFFLENKVFHLEMKSLVEHINTIDLEEWWNEVIQHELYQGYKNTFAKDVRSQN